MLGQTQEMAEHVFEVSTVSLTNNANAQKTDFFGDDLFFFIMSINMGIICQIISVFGTISNVVNTTIFVKQGFQDSTSISLLALTISDLCSLLTIMWTNLCYTPAFRDTQIYLISWEVQLISGIWPHVIFTRTTGWITAFISFERCLCVIVPLKVRNIFTRKRHIISMVTIYVVTLGLSAFAYFSLGLGWKFFPPRNHSAVGLIFHMENGRRIIVDQVSYGINGVFMPMSCFTLVVSCTGVLVFKLNQQAVWRNASSSINSHNKANASSENMSTRDKKVSKMVVLISSIFISCFIPAVFAFIAGCVEPQFTYDGVYKNLFLVVLSISFITEAINSSINIFIYFTMSTKYRNTFNGLFKLK